MNDFIGAIVGAIFGDRLSRRRSRQHANQGDYDCALRRLGAKPGAWERGQARVAPAELKFSRRDMRLGESRVIGVHRVLDDGRSPTSRETWGMNPRAVIFRLDTTEGDLDWAVISEDARDLARTLAAHE